MERIHYAGGTILTGTEISRALLQYAAALARSDSSATVDVPVRDEHGELATANMLIGPASQLISLAETSGGEEIVDEDLVAELRTKTEHLGPMRAIADGELFAGDDGGVLDGLGDFEPPLLGDEPS